MRAASDRRLFFPVLVALIGLAWMATLVWGYSPYGVYLSHEQLEEAPFGPSPQLGLLVAGWTLMTLAMMLPTSLPLVSIVQRMTQARPDGLRLLAALIAGYLGVWALFGLLAHLGDGALHHLSERSGWLETHEWIIAAGTFTLAGAYQFSALKYRCLDQCRSPLAFVAQRWRGRPGLGQLFGLGVRHGVFCVGCCWSLMLLMFVVGIGNIAWMLALGSVMAIEKNMPWGRQFSAPLGMTLLGMAVLTTLANLA